MGCFLVCATIFLTIVPVEPEVSEPVPQKRDILDLPVYSTPEGFKSQSIEIGKESGLAHVWGQGTERPRIYFDEFLPAIFERTLRIDMLELSGDALEWIFTGDHGGFTVRIEKNKVILTQRFYDSFGLHNKEERIVHRHPEKEWTQSSIAYRGLLQAVTVVLDHKLGISVFLNGKKCIQQLCYLDVSRHQFRITGLNGGMEGSLLTPSPRRAIVKIDPNVKHQTMMGFGGITSAPAYSQLSTVGKRKWWELVCAYNLLIQREYPIGTRLRPDMRNWDILYDATPHYYGDNFPNGEISNFEYIRTLRRFGGHVFFEFWDLPPWATQEWKNKDGTIHSGVANPEKYAKAMVNYCVVSQKKAGAPPDIVGIQNEREQPKPIWKEMVRTLRRELDRAGFKKVRIHMSDAGKLKRGITWIASFRDADDVWNTIDYAAVHMYDYQEYFTNPDDYDNHLRRWQELIGDKDFLSTEICINRPRYQLSTYRLALMMGQLYHKNLVLADAKAILYCWTLLNVVQPSYGWTRSLCVPDRGHGFVPAASSYQLRVYGAYSRRIHEGMIRIETTSTEANLLATAFTDGSGKKTLVLLNRSTTPLQVEIHWPSATFCFLELVDPYHENEIKRIPQCMKPGIIKAMVNPGAFVTLSTVVLKEIPKDFIKSTID